MWLKTPIMESSEPVMFNFVGNKNFLEGDYGLEVFFSLSPLIKFNLLVNLDKKCPRNKRISKSY